MEMAKSWGRNKNIECKVRGSVCLFIVPILILHKVFEWVAKTPILLSKKNEFVFARGLKKKPPIRSKKIGERFICEKSLREGVKR